MSRSICLITGATSGIGRAAALRLAELGHRVLVIGRDDRKLKDTVRLIRGKIANEEVDSYRCDLSLGREVRQLAREIKQDFQKLDVLINNAGARFLRHGLTEEGIELTLATNHIGHFALTLSLIDLLARSEAARVINVSSGAHYGGAGVMRNIRSLQEYDGKQQYAESKLANILFTYALAEKVREKRISVNAMAPGGVATNFSRNNGLFPWLKHRFYYLMKGQLKTPAQGAETIVFLATSDAVSGVTGQYFEDKMEKRSSEISYNREAQERLWVESCKWSGVDYAG